MKNLLNKYFEKIYVITSYETTDRFDDLNQKFMSENIQVEFVVSPKKKYFGNFLNEPSSLYIGSAAHSLYCSMESIFLASYLNKYESILVFEDDVVFADNYISKLTQFMRNLPDDWEILNLGYHINSTIPNTFKKFGKFQDGVDIVGTHAMAYKKCVFDYVISEFDENTYPVDWFLQKIIYKNFNTYFPVDDILFYASSYRQYELDNCEDYKKYKSTLDD